MRPRPVPMGGFRQSRAPASGRLLSSPASRARQRGGDRRKAAGMAGEEELLARARAGDAAAFGALLEPHRGRVWSVCLRITGSHHDAEDDFRRHSLRRGCTSVGSVPTPPSGPGSTVSPPTPPLRHRRRRETTTDDLEAALIATPDHAGRVADTLLVRRDRRPPRGLPRGAGPARDRRPHLRGDRPPPGHRGADRQEQTQQGPLSPRGRPREWGRRRMISRTLDIARRLRARSSRPRHPLMPSLGCRPRGCSRPPALGWIRTSLRL